jgi:hypothetical protein
LKVVSSQLELELGLSTPREMGHSFQHRHHRPSDFDYLELILTKNFFSSKAAFSKKVVALVTMK